MGTITVRKAKNGEKRYTAQIRLRRNGAIVYQESQTFERRQVAKAWLSRRETELADAEVKSGFFQEGETLKSLIERYLKEVAKIRPIGRTKQATLTWISNSWLGDTQDREITSQLLVKYAQWRMSDEGGGVQGQTVSNDLAHLGAVLSVAKPAWGNPIDPHAMPDARKVLRKLGVDSRSRERQRRPTLNELDKLLTHFSEMYRRRPSSIPMPKVIAFALFSTRRQEEITRIRWDDLDVENHRVLVRNMKNPGQKIGNNVWCDLPGEAWTILQSMPKREQEIFPYNGRTVSSAFTKACKLLKIEDLHFHDLRHEGVSRLFEMDWDIPRVSAVSGHRDWTSMRRYTHMRGRGDPYLNWAWMDKIVMTKVVAPKGSLPVRKKAARRRTHKKATE